MVAHTENVVGDNASAHATVTWDRFTQVLRLSLIVNIAEEDFCGFLLGLSGLNSDWLLFLSVAVEGSLVGLEGLLGDGLNLILRGNTVESVLGLRRDGLLVGVLSAFHIAKLGGGLVCLLGVVDVLTLH